MCTSDFHRFSAPHLQVKVKNTAISALVDSGSPFSCIEYDLLDKLGFVNLMQDPPLKHLRDLSEKKVTVCGQIELGIILINQDNEEQTIFHNFLVVKRIGEKMSLSLQFLIKNHLTIDNHINKIVST